MGRFPLFLAGMGAGKSHTVRKKYLARTFDHYPFMTRRNPSWYLAPTYDMVSNQILPEVEFDLAQMGIRTQYHKTEHMLTFDVRGHRCHTRMLSAQNYNRYMGPEVPFMTGDELELCFNANPVKTELMFQKLMSRLRMRGTSRSFDIGTTPEGFGFAYKWWKQRPEKDPSLKSDYRMYNCSTYENERNLPEDYIPTLLRDYGEGMAQAYIHGRFSNLKTGNVYHAFRRELHTARGLKVDRHFPIEFSFDFNVAPMSCGISQYIDPDLIWPRVLQDRSRKGTMEMCRILVAEYGWHPGPVIVYGDATGKRLQSSSAGRSDRDIIASILEAHWGRGNVVYRWERRNPWLPDRYAAVNAFLESGRCLFDEIEAEAAVLDLEQQPFKEGSRQADDLGGTIGHVADLIGYRIYTDWPPSRTLAERARGVGLAA